MHACGHDGHTAIGLVLAELLAGRSDQLHGTVKFAFQPAEEQVSGAAPMVADGVLRDPAVDAVIGLHLWSPVHVGDVTVPARPVLARAYPLTPREIGPGGDSAMPDHHADSLLTVAPLC